MAELIQHPRSFSIMNLGNLIRMKNKFFTHEPILRHQGIFIFIF